MSKIPLFRILAIALPLAAGHAQSPKAPIESDLFKAVDSLNDDPANMKTPGAPKEKPGSQTEITADNTEFSNKTRIAIFYGGVVVVNPDFNVTCDKLTAYLKREEKPASAPDAKTQPGTPPSPAPVKSKGGLEKAVAEMTTNGKVLITQEKKELDGSVTHSVGRAEKAVYNATSGDITLTGSPEIRQGISRVVPAEEGVTLILNRDGRYRAIGRTKTLLQDNNDKPAKQ